MSITQRISDYLRERRVRRLSRQAKAAYAAGDRQRTRELIEHMKLECFARSPGQVARMERKWGISP